MQDLEDKFDEILLHQELLNEILINIDDLDESQVMELVSSLPISLNSKLSETIITLQSTLSDSKLRKIEQDKFEFELQQAQSKINKTIEAMIAELEQWHQFREQIIKYHQERLREIQSRINRITIEIAEVISEAEDLANELSSISGRLFAAARDAGNEELRNSIIAIAQPLNSLAQDSHAQIVIARQVQEVVADSGKLMDGLNLDQDSLYSESAAKEMKSLFELYESLCSAAEKVKETVNESKEYKKYLIEKRATLQNELENGNISENESRDISDKIYDSLNESKLRTTELQKSLSEILTQAEKVKDKITSMSIQSLPEARKITPVEATRDAARVEGRHADSPRTLMDRLRSITNLITTRRQNASPESPVARRLSQIESKYKSSGDNGQMSDYTKPVQFTDPETAGNESSKPKQEPSPERSTRRNNL